MYRRHGVTPWPLPGLLIDDERRQPIGDIPLGDIPHCAHEFLCILLQTRLGPRVRFERVSPPKGARFAPDQWAAALILQTYTAVPDVLVYR